MKPSAAIALMLLACLLAPPDARSATYSGTLSPPAVSPGGEFVSAQASVTAQCSPSEYCGFFPVVTTVEGAASCTDTITGSSWVGPLADTDLYSTTETVTATATWSEYPILYAGAKRACLYADPDGVLVAEATYAVPAPAAAPVYTPPVTDPVPDISLPAPTEYVAPQSLGRREAVRVTKRWMKRKYGKRWRKGHRRIVRCPVRTSSAQIGCYAVWRYKRRIYSRSIVITETTDSYTISRSFISAPPQSSTPPTGDFCSTHVCIPNFPNGTGTIVRCSDGTYSHSGGRQGACSHHGGVASLHARVSGTNRWAGKSRSQARADVRLHAATLIRAASSAP